MLCGRLSFVSLSRACLQFVGGKFEARDHMIKSNTTREFDLEEEHKVRGRARDGEGESERTRTLKTLTYSLLVCQKMTKKLVLDDFEIKPVPKPNGS